MSSILRRLSLAFDQRGINTAVHPGRGKPRHTWIGKRVPVEPQLAHRLDELLAVAKLQTGRRMLAGRAESIGVDQTPPRHRLPRLLGTVEGERRLAQDAQVGRRQLILRNDRAPELSGGGRKSGRRRRRLVSHRSNSLFPRSAGTRARKAAEGDRATGRSPGAAGPSRPGLRRGGLPTFADLVLEEEELAARLAAVLAFGSQASRSTDYSRCLAQGRTARRGCRMAASPC